MSSRETDISQIKQYLNGELDARAMHELEKRAQQDPFLMDALEGYETAKTDQEQHLSDLQQRLQQRVGGAKQTIIPWPLVSIAASVIVLSLLGILWYRLAPSKPAAVLAANQASASVPDTLAPALPRPSAPISTFKPASPLVKQPQLAAVRLRPVSSRTSPINSKVSTGAEVRIDEPVGNAPVSSAITATDTTRPVAAQGYFTYRKAEILGGRATLKPDSQGRIVNRLLKSRVDGVQVETAEGQHHVVGTLLDGIDGQPLAGVSVRLKNLPNKTMTNKDGAFSIAANAKDVLVMSSLGYQSQEVKVGKTDSMSVALQPDNKALAEVAVVGYGTKRIVKAAPIIGWDAYKSYLTTAVSPDHQTGRVKLSFTVKADGNLSDFKILNSISKATDEAAIHHVKNGPAWHTNTQRSPEQVTLEISFQ